MGAPPCCDKTNVKRGLGLLRKMLRYLLMSPTTELETEHCYRKQVTFLSKIAQGTQNTDPNAVAVSQTALIIWEASSSFELVENKPASVAQFLKSTPNLDK
ncbi:hypothetical protein S83_063423, partial [Arachis hypogaea]